MRMQPLKNGMIEITIKGLVDKIYVKNEKVAIQIAMGLGGKSC